MLGKHPAYAIALGLQVTIPVKNPGACAQDQGSSCRTGWLRVTHTVGEQCWAGPGLMWGVHLDSPIPQCSQQRGATPKEMPENRKEVPALQNPQMSTMMASEENIICLCITAAFLLAAAVSVHALACARIWFWTTPGCT